MDKDGIRVEVTPLQRPSHALTRRLRVIRSEYVTRNLYIYLQTQIKQEGVAAADTDVLDLPSENTFDAPPLEDGYGMYQHGYLSYK